MNINITENAKEKLTELLKDNQNGDQPKIVIAGYGWGGPTFTVVLGEPTEDEVEIEVDGFKVLVDETMANIYMGFSIDYMNSFFRKGFIVNPLR